MLHKLHALPVRRTKTCRPPKVPTFTMECQKSTATLSALRSFTGSESAAAQRRSALSAEQTLSELDSIRCSFVIQARQEDLPMSDQFWLTEAQLKRIEPFFPKSRGVPRVDDRRVVSGIIHVIRNGLRWRDAPAVYGPHKTLYNRFVRWSRLGIFDRIFADLAAKSGPSDCLMIDSTHLKAHRTSASLLKKGALHAASGAPRAA
jgi:putative transposase